MEQVVEMMNLSPWKAKTCLSSTANSMVAVVWAMQGARGLIQYKDAILQV